MINKEKIKTKRKGELIWIIKI
jgi:hypothetical protein